MTLHNMPPAKYGDGFYIRTAIIRFINLCLIAAIPPLLILLDLRLRDVHGSIGETSLTEYAQTACLLLTFALFSRLAIQLKAARGFYLLVSGFFLCMLIREHDFLFDIITHGWWKYPALAVTALALAGARYYRGTVIGPMAKFTRLSGFSQLMLGLVVVLVFSRVFGTGSLWREVMQDQYENLYKSVIQEGLELLGYLLIAYGSVLLSRTPAELKACTHPR